MRIVLSTSDFCRIAAKSSPRMPLECAELRVMSFVGDYTFSADTPEIDIYQYVAENFNISLYEILT